MRATSGAADAGAWDDPTGRVSLLDADVVGGTAGPGVLRRGPDPDAGACRGARPAPPRVQCGRLPRQAAGSERVPTLAAGLRPVVRPGCADAGGPGPADLPGGPR